GQRRESPGSSGGADVFPAGTLSRCSGRRVEEATPSPGCRDGSYIAIRRPGAARRSRWIAARVPAGPPPTMAMSWSRCIRRWYRAKPSPAAQRKSPPGGGLLPEQEGDQLLDLAFLVDHVLADGRIVLLDLHLAGRVLLVLVGGVEVAGAGRGDQADLVALGSHGRLLLRSFRRGHAARPERS